MKLLLYVHHRVCIGECRNYVTMISSSFSWQTSACSMLITATFYVMGIDLNILKTSLISIAAIVKTYNSCSKSIRESFTCNTYLFHMQACQPITAVGVYTESHSRHAPSNQVRKNALFLNSHYYSSKKHTNIIRATQETL